MRVASDVPSMPPENSVMTLVRYLSVSIGVYVFILTGMYVLVDWLRINKIFSYIIVYVCAYLVEYMMTLMFVFREAHRWVKVLKFIAHTLIFLILGTLLFRALLDWHIQYLAATILVALLLLPLRFISNKYFVYC